MSYTALIVDDSQITRSALERALKMTSIPFDHILLASNGEEALNYLENHWIDIVFSDIHMPVMSGIELIKKLKSREDFSRIPVIVISTEGSTTRIQELNSQGINGYLRKPFAPEAIRDIVSSVLLHK